MTTELSYLAWSAVLGLVQLFVAAVAKRGQEPPGWQAGPRDEPAPAYGALTGRLMRAQSNFMESFPFFAAAVLTAHVAGRTDGLSVWGVQLYFWGRLVYAPLYAAGIAYVRTVAWIVSIAGLVCVLVCCLLPP